MFCSVLSVAILCVFLSGYEVLEEGGYYADLYRHFPQPKKEVSRISGASRCSRP
jgi:hypothetical protein